MPKIIVPTDFSETSASAVRYASYLADATGYDLEVLHVHDGYGNTDRLVEKKGNLSARMEAQRALDQFVRFNVPPSTFTGSRDTGDVLPLVQCTEQVGSPVETILAAAKEAKAGLIVMGGVGSGNVSTITPLFGSVARSVAMQAACPVFLIPPGYGTPDIKVVSIAFEKVAPLKEISDGMAFLRKALKLKMRFVHVQSDNSANENEIETNLLNTVLDTEFPGYPVELDLIPPGTVSGALTDYTLKENVDLLVLGRRNRGFFKRLFLSSETAPMLQSSAVPVLVVPIADY